MVYFMHHYFCTARQNLILTEDWWKWVLFGPHLSVVALLLSSYAGAHVCLSRTVAVSCLLLPAFALTLTMSKYVNLQNC